MDPLMVYAEVKKMGFKTLICDYERGSERDKERLVSISGRSLGLRQRCSAHGLVGAMFPLAS
jgi:hypothetical protein